MRSTTNRRWQLIRGGLPWLSRSKSRNEVRKSNRAAASELDRSKEVWGVGQDWAKPAYGEYYATSVPIYAAIKVRSEALGRQRLIAFHNEEPVPEVHPVQQLLDRVNRWTTQGELWRATETYLNLWGSAFWALEQDEAGNQEIWPLRPDRMRVIPDKKDYIRGYVYSGSTGSVPYTSEQVVWLRYFNPLEEYAGLSPVAPLRLSVDMGQDALRFNRNFFKNSARPDIILTTEESMTDDEVAEFYERWESRYQGPANAHRPAIASFIKDVKPVGFTQREMEFILGLRWSLEDVSRVYGVPLPLLSDYQQATFTNIKSAEQLFWRNTMIPEMRFMEEQLNQKLLPMLGYGDIKLRFDTKDVEALRQGQDSLVNRQTMLLDRGALTINEVRQQHNLPAVPWGDTPYVPAGHVGPSTGGETPSAASHGPTWRTLDSDGGSYFDPAMRNGHVTDGVPTHEIPGP